MKNTHVEQELGFLIILQVIVLIYLFVHIFYYAFNVYKL